MKTLVTGGAGFIGSHLVERLINDGHEVIVLDDLSTGRKENISHIKSKKVHFIEIDISVPSKELDRLFQGVEWVFHLAALADIVPSIKHPLSYHRANVDGTFHVLEASRESGVKRFVYTASSSCYGIPKKYPTDEGAEIDPQYPYALTKYVGEILALSWEHIYKLPVVSLRLFNVYGQRSRTSGTYGAVFGVFLAQKIAGFPFTVVGDGTQTRDFTFVTDVVAAFIKAAQSNISGEVFNVGTGKPQSVNTLVKLLGGKVTYIPKRPGEPDKTHADSRKIEKMLGWKPKISFEAGVKIMLQNIDYWKKAPVWTPKTIQKETNEWFRYLS